MTGHRSLPWGRFVIGLETSRPITNRPHEDGGEPDVDSPPQGVIARLAHELGKLPGVGPKSAERLTHHLLAAPRNEVLDLADALRAVKEQIRPCSHCCHPTEHEICSLCSDPRRD